MTDATTDATLQISKRQKTAYKWKLTFHATGALRTLIDVVSNVIGRVNIKIVNTDEFTGISVDSIDSKRVCLIAAKLMCKLESDTTGDEVASFCVDTNTLCTCLRSVSPHYSIDIERTRDSEEIILRSYGSSATTTRRSSSYPLRTTATRSADLYVRRGLRLRCRDRQEHHPPQG